MFINECTDYEVPFESGMVDREMPIANFLWHAVAVRQIWEMRMKPICTNKNPSACSDIVIAHAHVIWMQRHPRCTDILFEVIAAVERLADDRSDIPPCILAFLSSVYAELDVIIETDIPVLIEGEK